MKKSELRMLIAEYNQIKLKIKKSNDRKLQEKIKQIEHRYFHETGNSIKAKSEEIT
ncbi:MAG: hypothetical protein K5790_08925 [Nitrosopumilus sp.]|uniref:hypothetical protein n=1 Tax=Nitrosopumilus sp. TaxID=2024843 RepID=UPI00247EC030|nr:hypothetical protein [Nitrosopumilus sp.]MCV0393391.1 hypothetical protein [Nitrosopumilus sp.]